MIYNPAGTKSFIWVFKQGFCKLGKNFWGKKFQNAFKISFQKSAWKRKFKLGLQTVRSILLFIVLSEKVLNLLFSFFKKPAFQMPI